MPTRRCRYRRFPCCAPADHGPVATLHVRSERGTKETALADVLSPVSKKKTGRAYVALARAHSEK